ncbi:MAG: discoidin domain-containing protein [Actinomycetes bacterium]
MPEGSSPTTRPLRAAGRRTALRALAVAVLAALVAPALSAPATAAPRVVESPTEVAFRQARTFALQQLAETARATPTGRYPVVAPGRGRWRTLDAASWMAGFLPGQLWQAYELSGNPTWARRAAARQAALSPRARDVSTHDLGFVLFDSFGQERRLTGDPASRDLLLTAAASLASRYVPAAKTLRSWDGPDGQVTVIVDNMVNLELLFWAARHGGPASWRTIALQHALTTRDQLVRPDGSTFHAVRFDETTGRRLWRGTVQGWRDSSTWGRGQSWAVYGFTGAYRETHDRRMLAVARRTADYALRHLPPDGVPYWDYDLPQAKPTFRDSSAGAVLASGLLELALLDPSPHRRERYRAAALHTLRSLTGPHYLAAGTKARSVLLHAHHNAAYPDAGTAYGDYYLLEALQRVQLQPSTRPALPVVRATADRAQHGHPAHAVLDGAASTRWSATGVSPRLTLDLGRARTVSAVSVAWWHGSRSATRLRVRTSRDGRSWTTARTVVSSGRSSRLETYDVPDRQARYVRLVCPGGSGDRRVDISTVRVRG